MASLLNVFQNSKLRIGVIEDVKNRFELVRDFIEQTNETCVIITEHQELWEGFVLTNVIFFTPTTFDIADGPVVFIDTDYVNITVLHRLLSNYNTFIWYIGWTYGYRIVNLRAKYLSFWPVDIEEVTVPKPSRNFRLNFYFSKKPPPNLRVSGYGYCKLKKDCLICFEKFSKQWQLTCCNVYICNNCADKWFSNHLSCPHCRKEQPFVKSPYFQASEHALILTRHTDVRSIHHTKEIIIEKPEEWVWVIVDNLRCVGDFTVNIVLNP